MSKSKRKVLVYKLLEKIHSTAIINIYKIIFAHYILSFSEIINIDEFDGIKEQGRKLKSNT